MENFDPRRRRGHEGPAQNDRSRHGHESGGHDWRQESSRFSPDWSQEGAEPMYSDDPYYSRNRGEDPSSERSRGGESGGWQRDESRGESGGWQGDERRMTTREQRARGFVPREQFERSERGRRFGGSERGGHGSGLDWPYLAAARAATSSASATTSRSATTAVTTDGLPLRSRIRAAADNCSRSRG